MDTQQAANYKEAETHFKQALQLHHTVEVSCCTLRGASARAAVDKLADKAAPEGLYPTLVDLGQLYGLMSWCKNDDELQVHQEALDEVRGDIAHASMPQLQMHLSRILSDMGQMHIIRYGSQIANGANGDKGNCTIAKALLEKALSIHRAHSQDGMAAHTLTILASAHGYLKMFDDARSTLKEAPNLNLVVIVGTAHKWLYATRKWQTFATSRPWQS